MKKINWKEVSKSDGYKKLKSEVVRGYNKSRKNKSSYDYERKLALKKFKWIIDRAKHYSHVTQIPIQDILNAWEKNRTYWYRNYYQDCELPKLTKYNRVIIVNDLEEFFIKYPKKDGYKCSFCNKIQNDPYECKLCGWKIYGFFRLSSKAVFVFVKSKARGERIFKPAQYKKI